MKSRTSHGFPGCKAASSLSFDDENVDFTLVAVYKHKQVSVRILSPSPRHKHLSRHLTQNEPHQSHSVESFSQVIQSSHSVDSFSRVNQSSRGGESSPYLCHIVGDRRSLQQQRHTQHQTQLPHRHAHIVSQSQLSQQPQRLGRNLIP